MACWRQTAFGLDIESSFPLPTFRPGPGEGRHVELRLGDDDAVERLWSGPAGAPLWVGRVDAGPFVLEQGRGGDHLMAYSDRARFRLSADMTDLTCAPVDADDPAWQRQLLDTVLLLLSALCGFELLHASAILGRSGVLTFSAPSGGGKSSLATELASRGYRLFSDDMVALEHRDGALLAHPGPPVANVPIDHAARDRLGTTIATFGEQQEAWISVHDMAAEPAPLQAAFVLERRPGARTEVERLGANPLHLLPHSRGFRHRQERYRDRFQMFSDLAAQIPIYRLQADVAVPAAALADLVEAAVRTPSRAS